MPQGRPRRGENALAESPQGSLPSFFLGDRGERGALLSGCNKHVDCVPRRTRPPQEQVRQQVDQVMANWRSCPDFAHLFDGLLKANGEINESFASRATQVTGSSISKNTIGLLRRGLRSAVDLDVSMSAVANVGGQSATVRYVKNLSKWENESESVSPSLSQGANLLVCYNHLLREKGREELSDEEIQRVMEIARRHRQDGLAHGFRKRAHEYRPLAPRRTITPDFDIRPSREATTKRACRRLTER